MEWLIIERLYVLDAKRIKTPGLFQIVVLACDWLKALVIHCLKENQLNTTSFLRTALYVDAITGCKFGFRYPHLE